MLTINKLGPHNILQAYIIDTDAYKSNILYLIGNIFFFFINMI